MGPSPSLHRAQVFLGLFGCCLTFGACNLVGGIHDVEGNENAGGDGEVSCENPDRVDLQANGDSLTLSGNTQTGQRLLNNPPTGCDKAKGPERVYRVKALSEGLLTVTLQSTDTQFDSVLYARKNVCDAPSSSPWKACNDRHRGGQKLLGGEVLSFPISKDEEIDVVVDGYEENDAGSYKVRFNLSPGKDCTATVPIVIDPGSLLVLDTQLAKGADAASLCGICSADLCAGESWQTIYEISSPTATTVYATVESALDTVLYGRASCNMKTPQIGDPGCVDNNLSSNETLTIPVDTTPVYLFVDYGGLGALEGGPATVVLLADSL